MIETVVTLSAMRKLESEWNHLGSMFDTPLLQYDWFISCAENLHRESDLRIIILRVGGQIKAIAPLVKRKYVLAHWLEILGSSTLYEPAGFLYDSEQSLDALMHAVVSIGFPINLSRIPHSSPLLRAAQTLPARRVITITRPSASSCYIATTINWDEFYTQIGKKWRADFRNKKRRAEKLGKTVVDIFKPTVDQLEFVLTQAVEIEACSWKSKQGSTIRDNRKLRAFISDYAHRSCKNGIFYMCFLRINETPVAMNLGISFGNKLWFLKTGFNDKWSRVSPGMQLNMECIRYAFENGFTGYEFLGSEESWQKAWPVDLHRYSSLIVLPYSVKGFLGFIDIVLTYAKNRIRQQS